MNKSDRFKHTTTTSCAHVIDGTPWSHARMQREAAKAGISMRAVYYRLKRGENTSEKLFCVRDKARQDRVRTSLEKARKEMADIVAGLDARKAEMRG